MDQSKIIIILLVVVFAETGWIVKNHNKKPAVVEAKPVTKIMGPNEKDQEIKEVKTVIQTNLGKEVEVKKVDQVPSAIRFEKVETQFQKFFIDRESGLAFVGGYLIDMKNKINLTTGEPILVANGFIHPSKAMGEKMLNSASSNAIPEGLMKGQMKPPMPIRPMPHQMPPHQMMPQHEMPNHDMPAQEMPQQAPAATQEQPKQ